MLSFKDKIDYFISNKIFGIDLTTQYEYICYLKNAIEEFSDDKVRICIKSVKEIVNDIDNCINKDDELTRPKKKGYENITTLGNALKEKLFWNNIELSDTRPFVCYYSVDDKQHFYVEPNSICFISDKTEKGTRPIIGCLCLDSDDEFSFGHLLKNQTIPRILNPDEFEEKRKKIEKKKSITETIDDIIKNLNDLKNELVNIK